MTTTSPIPAFGAGSSSPTESPFFAQRTAQASRILTPEPSPNFESPTSDSGADSFHIEAATVVLLASDPPVVPPAQRLQPLRPAVAVSSDLQLMADGVTVGVPTVEGKELPQASPSSQHRGRDGGDVPVNALGMLKVVSIKALIEKRRDSGSRPQPAPVVAVGGRWHPWQIVMIILGVVALGGLYLNQHAGEKWVGGLSASESTTRSTFSGEPVVARVAVVAPFPKVVLQPAMRESVHLSVAEVSIRQVSITSIAGKVTIVDLAGLSRPLAQLGVSPHGTQVQFQVMRFDIHISITL
jgi:hypothetical protein